MRKLLAELNSQDEGDQVLIFEDNHACAQWAEKEGLDHNRTKHIDIRYHMIRDNVKKQNVKVEICPTQEMVADIMTKALGRDLHERATMKMMGYVDTISKPGQKLSGSLIRGEITLTEKNNVHYNRRKDVLKDNKSKSNINSADPSSIIDKMAHLKMAD